MSLIGVFGASFDPCHKGHLSCLKAFIDTFPFGKVFVVPTGQPPHKKKTAASDEDRLNMLKLALKAIPKAEICEYELNNAGKSYTVNTLRWLKTKYPSSQFMLFTGSDMFLSLDRWYMPEEIMRLASIAVFSRYKNDSAELKLQAEKLRFGYGADCRIIDFEPIVISSTELRESIAAGKDVSEYLTPEVYDYIKKHRLYVPSRFTAEELRKAVKVRLTPERYRHSMAVAKTAVLLAQKYGADPVKAEIAGITHDVTKNMTDQAQIAYADTYKLGISDSDRQIPQVLHSLTGAHYAEYFLDIKDEEILSAIGCHTTGKPGMSLLDKIIYTADAIDETRTYSDVDEYRNLAFSNITNAVFAIIKWTVLSKAEQNRPIHPRTVTAYNSLLKDKNLTIERKEK